MRLADIMALRQSACAGVFVTVTDRCPLTCAHCSTASTMRGRELDADLITSFLATASPQDRPEVVMLTGGEPMMRPGLVVDVASVARERGASTAVLTGGFFLRAQRIPEPIRRAVTAVDHFSLSVDAFHEREVDRTAVFALLRTLLDSGVDTSLHIVGTGPDDPYLADVTSDVRRTFGTDVPMLVSELRPIGRAATWARRPIAADGDRAAPCALAAWPVITVDGTVTACCNQDVVNGADRPDHLRLGHIATDSWPQVRERATATPLLRMIRTVGPLYIGARAGCRESGVDYCTGCQRLGAQRAATAWADGVAAGAVGEVLERESIQRLSAAGPAALLRRYGADRYADLVGVPDRGARS